MVINKMIKKKNIWLGTILIILGIVLCFISILPGILVIVIGASYFGYEVVHKGDKK